MAFGATRRIAGLQAEIRIRHPQETLMPTFSKGLPEIKIVEELEKVLGIPQGFFVHLEDENDWSYVVKLHTLFDAAVTQLIKSALNNSRLDEIINSLQLNNRRTGKLAYIQALDLLSDCDLNFIEFLSGLRNRCVHKIQDINFNIDDHFSSFSDKKIRETLVQWGLNVPKQPEEDEGKSFVQIFKVKPKLFIQMTAMYMLQQFLLRDITHRAKSGEMAMDELKRILKLVDDQDWLCLS